MYDTARAGRTRQAAGAGGQPPEAAARHLWAERRVYAAVGGGADAGGGHGRRVRGRPAAWGVFGAMLLREDAGGYVLVAVVSFAAAAAITALCFRLRSKENQKKDGTDKPNRHEQEEKSQ